MALNSRQGYMSSVGARFLFLRVESLTDEERCVSMTGIFSKAKKIDKAEIAKIVCRYCRQIKMETEIKPLPEITSKVEDQLKALARLTALARGIVITNPVSYQSSDGKKLTSYEVDDIQVEEPFRALKQLKKLAECLAIVNGKHFVSEEEIAIVKRVVLSSMPVRRADILKVFEMGSVFTVKEAAEKLDKNNKTVRRNLDELVSLNVLDCTKEGIIPTKEYFMKEDFSIVLGFTPHSVCTNKLETIGVEDDETLPF